LFEETVVTDTPAMLGMYFKREDVHLRLTFACQGEIYGVESVVSKRELDLAKIGPAAAKEMIRRGLFRQMGDKVYEIYFGVAGKEG